jgi:hypothetical protein
MTARARPSSSLAQARAASASVRPLDVALQPCEVRCRGEYGGASRAAAEPWMVDEGAGPAPHLGQIPPLRGVVEGDDDRDCRVERAASQ